MRGYSLLELLVVLAVLALIAATVSWGVGRGQPREIANNAEAIVAARIAEARKSARATGRVIALEASAASASHSSGAPNTGEAGAVITTSAPIHVDPDGFISGGIVTVQLPDGGAMEVKIEPLSGTLTVEGIE